MGVQCKGRERTDWEAESVFAAKWRRRTRGWRNGTRQTARGNRSCVEARTRPGTRLWLPFPLTAPSSDQLVATVLNHNINAMVKDKEDAKKSRSKTHIPRSISAPKPQLAEPRLLDSTIDKSEYIRESLLSIGAPDVSPEEMRRLCKGPLADALFFIAEHLKGRMEVNRVRTAIQQYVTSTCFCVRAV